MNKKSIIITVSSILLLGAGIGTFLYFRSKKKANDSSKRSEEEDYGKTKKAIEELGGGIAVPDTNEYSEKDKMKGKNPYPLKVGSEGRRVATLQALLNYNKGAGLAIDGVFGNQTRFALLKSGFLGCTIASSCEVTKEEFEKMTLERKDPKEFIKIYNIKNNADMKAVWNKYSS